MLLGPEISQRRLHQADIMVFYTLKLLSICMYMTPGVRQITNNSEIDSRVSKQLHKCLHYVDSIVLLAVILFGFHYSSYACGTATPCGFLEPPKFFRP